MPSIIGETTGSLSSTQKRDSLQFLWRCLHGIQAVIQHDSRLFFRTTNFWRKQRNFDQIDYSAFHKVAQGHFWGSTDIGQFRNHLSYRISNFLKIPCTRKVDVSGDTTHNIIYLGVLIHPYALTCSVAYSCNGVGIVREVTLRQALLVLGPSSYRQATSVCNQPSRSTQPPSLSWPEMSTGQSTVMLCGWGV